MRAIKLAMATFTGAFASALLIVVQAIYESVGRGSAYEAWLALPLPLFEMFVLIAPGLVAGRIAKNNSVLAGSLATTLTGALLYYGSPMGHGVPVDEWHAVAYLSASVLAYCAVGALVGAVSGAASATLRSNKRVQPTCEDARG